MAVPIGNDDREQSSSDDEERSPLRSVALDERVLAVVRHARADDARRRTVRPALLAAELGLSVEEATRELCGLLAAVGGGEDGASFAFERAAALPPGDGEGPAAGGAAATATATVMVFTFPPDFDRRAKRHRNRADWKARLRSLAEVFVKAIKIFTAFGLIISLAVLIVVGICLLVAAVVALARGGHGGGGRNHPLMHRLRYLFFQLRSILWLYAICGSAVDGNQDPFTREIAGDLAFMMSICCGNPLHPFFWFRAGGMRRRWSRLRNRRGWGGSAATWNSGGSGIAGVEMTRQGTWGEERRGDRPSPSSLAAASSLEQDQRGLLSIAVEFLFGPARPGVDELQKWKFRASVVMTLSSTSQGNGISLRELLPYVDRPPASASHPSAIRETLSIVSYFNGKPADVGDDAPSSDMDARFCFPEIVAEMDCQKLIITMGSSECAPPASSINDPGNFASILYKEEESNHGGASDAVPEYLYEKPFALTELSRQHFGRCLLLGLLNLAGVVWMRNALLPGGLLQLSVAAASRRRPLVAFAAVLLLKLLGALRLYAGLFFVLPLCRLGIVLLRNCGVARRNKRRSEFVRAEL